MTRHNDEGADAHASLMGKWSLANPTVSWLIGRGYGEIVALRSEEFERPMATPICRGHGPMKFRPGYWACYDADHREPVKIRHRIRDEIPDFPGSIEDALDQIVDLRYGVNSLNGYTEWHYRTRAL